VHAEGEIADFVSRFFAPKYGIDEDPVTGSSHCELVPYWSGKLHKKELRAVQLSKRGGEILCRDMDTRVLLSGRAVLYLEGVINL
jgi:predicted PhzF superfamily epimerase YddE/YHI9